MKGLELALLAVGICFGVLLIFVGHWAPWPKPLSFIARYTYGVSCGILAFTIWRANQDDWVTPLGLFVIFIFLGLATAFSYGIDTIVLQMHKAEKAEIVDDNLTK